MAHRAKINDCENCNEKNVCEVKNIMNNYGFRCKMFSPYRPQTNADRIRAMTDEELADWLSIYCCRNKTYDAHCETFGNCKSCWLGWLNEEATDGEQG